MEVILGFSGCLSFQLNIHLENVHQKTEKLEIAIAFFSVKPKKN